MAQPSFNLETTLCTGKTCIAAAVVQSTPVRSKFPDGIAWLTLSQKPKLRGLQRRLHFQILKDQFPKGKQGSAQEQHQYLMDALATKTVLIVLDGNTFLHDSIVNVIVNVIVLSPHYPIDCWDSMHHKLLDVIDKQTSSMLLLSTRISGLLAGSACTQVQLSLMTMPEAIELLAHGSGLDSAEASSHLVEVAGLCGREYCV
jgi:hypothetical protein